MRKVTRRRRALATLAGTLAATAVLTTPAEAATVRTVAVAWQHQTHQYNCGPAATRIAISAHVPAASLPSQQAIGAYEGTSPSSRTDRYHVRQGLQHYDQHVPWLVVSIRNQGGYFTYAEARDFHDRIRSDINVGIPLVVNIVVHPGGARPPGWSNPRSTIDHWVVVTGYDSVGNILLTDPASTGAGFNPRSSYWISQTTLDHLVRKTYIW